MREISFGEMDREPGIKRIERFPNHTLSSLPFVRESALLISPLCIGPLHCGFISREQSQGCGHEDGSLLETQ